jgi:YggT family protein
MLVQSLVFLIESLGQLWILTALLRFFAQAFRAPFRACAGNPIADFVMALTDWAVVPTRRVFPSLFRLDTASFIVAWVAMALLNLAVMLMVGSVALSSPSFWSGLVAFAFVGILKASVYLFIGLMIIQAILSWVSPYHPMKPFFDTLTRPLLRPVQRFLPLIGGIDLSPLLVILLLQVLLIAPLPWLSQEAIRLMRWIGG